MKAAIAVLVIFAVAVPALLFLRQRTASKADEKPKFSDEVYQRHFEDRESALERVLGPVHTMVGHAIIPFEIGGAVDMYYFPNGIPGTGFATMELIQPDGTGPRPNRIGTYELVAFTKQTITQPDENHKDHPFTLIERRFCGIFSRLGFYSYDAVLNPGETCEVPGKEGEPYACLILDEYAPEGASFEIGGTKHCLLLCIEVFRSEMEYARPHGSAAVLTKLKAKGHYPYSDLDREPVY